MRSTFIGVLLTLCSLNASSENLKQIRIATQPNNIDMPISFEKIQNVSCTQVNNKQFRQALLEAINEVRHQPRQCGLQTYPSTSALTWNDKLQLSAQAQVNDISNRRLLSHVDKSGRKLQQRFEMVGFSGKLGGENLANGQKTAHSVLNDWMTLSTTHCTNIMTEMYTDYALACTVNPSNGRAYWVQQFGSKEIN